MDKLTNFFLTAFSSLFIGTSPLISNDLEQTFKNPPKSAQPRTWMHAMDGNMSKEGLTKDLEAISKVGIGGVLLFSVSNGIPSGNVLFNSDNHIDLLKHAATESERLGLDFGVHNCDGWTASGGPWITPEKSMKMIVYNDTVLDGGNLSKVQLPQPAIRENFYKDIAVLAYPAFPSEIEDQNNKPTITTSDEKLNIATISDGRNDFSTSFNGSETKPGWILYEYKKPLKLASLLVSMDTRNPDLNFYISNDGIKFDALPKPAIQRPGKSEFAHSGSYKDISTKFIKIETNHKIEISEITFSSTQIFNNYLGRISMHKTSATKIEPIGEPRIDMIIDKNKIINLTNSIDSNGKLTTKLPSGKWTIMRFGYTSTGAQNYPATDSGRGLEVDKFDKDAVKIHYDAFVGKLVKAAKKSAPNALKYVEIDSYEMGGQNWTSNYDTIFKAEFGYDLISFLPLYAGRFVESAKSSEDVLWDVRYLNGKLMDDNYFGHFTELSHKDGLLTYIEPYGNGPLNSLKAGGHADIPMGEFWLKFDSKPTTITDPAVDAALIYGKNIISMEAFTSRPELNWKNHPALCKPTGDRLWTRGANEYMFHRFAHQANPNVTPGMTMGQWGSHFDRTNTWWFNAGKAWFEYLSRGQYMLRQGVPFVDFLVFAGDRAPNPGFDTHLPPQYKSCDVNTDVLFNRITVKNGKMVLPEGNQFQALILGNMKAISLKTLQRINELASQGVIIIGEKPVEMTGYKPSKDDLQEFNRLLNTIWSKPTTYNHYNWKEILPSIKSRPAFEVSGKTEMPYAYRKTPNEDIFFFYNTDTTAKTFDCTFNIDSKIPELWNAMTGETVSAAQYTNVDGRTKMPISLLGQESVFVVFRKPSDGKLSILNANNKALYAINEKKEITVTANENETYIAKTSENKDVKVEVKDIPAPIAIDGLWKVKFNKESGYDGTLSMTTLTDWSTSAIDEIKHYSGTATYQTTFVLKSGLLNKDLKFELDLGNVCIAAKVKLNGIEVGTAWIKPYTLDISKALKEGSNVLEIEVTNLWTNRLIGDERFEDKSGFENQTGKMPIWYVNNEPLPAGKRTTFTTKNFYSNDKTLLPSGLLGPVRITTSKKIIVQ